MQKKNSIRKKLWLSLRLFASFFAGFLFILLCCEERNILIKVRIPKYVHNWVLYDVHMQWISYNVLQYARKYHPE